MKQTIDHIDVEGKFVLMRADFNVPLAADGTITDARRITQALPTIRHILERDGRLVLMSHLGRPGGQVNPACSLRPVAAHLGSLLGIDISLVDDYTGDHPPEAVTRLRKGQVALLENLRFHPEETMTEAGGESDMIRKRQFARKIADLGDVYVNDAFGTCHRDNASMLTVPLLMDRKPKGVGFLVQKELRILGQALRDPARPFVCILGGAKVSDKIGLIEALIDRCDHILIGGAMAYTFMLARGHAAGGSLVEPDKVDEARRLIEAAGDKLRLPVDAVCAAEPAAGAATEVLTGDIPADLKGLDVGPRTLTGFADVLATARTIIWNGPMGVFETPPFDVGTMAIARHLAEATDRGATTIVGGGDSAAAIYASGIEARISHVSTGGGACLEFLEGRPFEAIEILDDA